MLKLVPTVRFLAACVLCVSVPQLAFAVCNPASGSSQDYSCPPAGAPDANQRQPNQQTGNGYRAPFNGYNESYGGNTGSFAHGGTQPPGGAYGYQGRGFGGVIGRSR